MGTYLKQVMQFKEMAFFTIIVKEQVFAIEKEHATIQSSAYNLSFL